MIETLITSKTRIKLLLKFFLNSKTTSYLRDLEEEFGESTNAIRVELNRFEKAGFLQSSVLGNKKLYKANINHPLFSDINNIVLKYIGLDYVIDKVVKKLGGLDSAWITGDFAKGMDGKVIDLLLIGEHIDKIYLIRLIEKVEKLINKKIRYFILSPDETGLFIDKKPEALLLWENQDKTG
jgi:hypothetical protein